MKYQLLSKKQLKKIKKFRKKYPNYLEYVDMDFPKKERGNNAWTKGRTFWGYW